MIVNANGFNVTQVTHDIAEIMDAAEAGGLKLAGRVYSAIVQARKLTVVEAVMLSGEARAACVREGIVLFRR